MALNVLKHRLLEQNRGDGDGGGNPGRTPAQINDEGNRSRLDRIEQIGRVADGRRAREMVDVDGERESGRFQGGDFDDSPAARERQAQIEEDEAAEALREQAERAQEADRLDQEEARRLQAEGGGDPDDERGERRPSRQEDDGDEKVVDGVRYYRTIVNGQERWLTLKQLRESAAASSAAEETLQRAQEALASATQAQLTPKEAPAELDDKELENIVLSAGMGDEEAVRKLVSVIKGRQAGASPQDVSRLVSQQIATQREVDRAEQAQAELLDNEILAPIFKQRLTEFAQSKPKTRIRDAYQAVGDQMRKDFAPLIQSSGSSNGTQPPRNKLDRKRTIVTPPRSAGRQPTRPEDDREVPIGEQIDAIARSRGQQRAHRIRRS